MNAARNAAPRAAPRAAPNAALSPEPLHAPALFALAVLALLALLAPPALAAPLRDPMQPPATAAPSAAGGPTAGAPAAEPATPTRHVIVVEGCAYVVERGRRHGVGDLLGGLRIEAIDESAITVRDAGALRRIPLYGAAAKRRTEAPSTMPAPARSPDGGSARPRAKAAVASAAPASPSTSPASQPPRPMRCPPTPAG